MTRKIPGARTARGRRALLQPLAAAALLCLATAAAAQVPRVPHSSAPFTLSCPDV